MKYALAALLVIFNITAASAQKNSFYGDGGISLARLYPGASVTYNYNIARFLGVGIGAQGYDFHATRTNYQFIPAVYGDLRFNISPRKRKHAFLFLDLGIDFYRHNNTYWGDGEFVYNVQKDNGTYTGIGGGYIWATPKHGWNYYLSAKVIVNSYMANTYNLVSGDQKSTTWGEGTLVISFGFRFNTLNRHRPANATESQK